MEEGEVGGKAGALGLAACGRGVGLFVEGELRDAERRGVVLGVGVERRGHTVGQASARYRRRGGGRVAMEGGHGRPVVGRRRTASIHERARRLLSLGREHVVVVLVGDVGVGLDFVGG